MRVLFRRGGRLIYLIWVVILILGRLLMCSRCRMIGRSEIWCLGRDLFSSGVERLYVGLLFGRGFVAKWSEVDAAATGGGLIGSGAAWDVVTCGHCLASSECADSG